MLFAKSIGAKGPSYRSPRGARHNVGLAPEPHDALPAPDRPDRGFARTDQHPLVRAHVPRRVRGRVLARAPPPARRAFPDLRAGVLGPVLLRDARRDPRRPARLRAVLWPLGPRRRP